ncbi:unnamed protein product, partial [Cyprideis torosa]
MDLSKATDEGRHRLILTADPALYNAFEASTSPDFVALFRGGKGITRLTRKKALDKVATDKSLVYMGAEFNVMLTMIREGLDRHFHLSRDRFFPQRYGIAFAKSNPFVHAFDQ